MASGSFNVTTDNQYISGKINWTSTKDDTNNQSTVNAEMRLSRTNSGFTTTGTGDFWIEIGGVRFTANSKSFTITENSNTLIMNCTRVVDHNTDGSKTVKIAWDGYTNVFDVNYSYGDATLDKIDRGRTNIKVNGAWKNGQTFIKVSGSWKQAKGVFLKVSGAWKRSI